MRSNWYAFAVLMHWMYLVRTKILETRDLTGYLKILIKHQALLCFSSKSELHLVHIFVKLHFECSLLFSAAVVGFVSVRHIKKKLNATVFTYYRRLVLSVHLFCYGYGSILLL